jgi:glutaredoxin 3
VEAGKSTGGEIVSLAEKVVMYCTAYCPFCLMADRLLADKAVTDVNRIRVDLEPDRREEMMMRTGRYTVPQIYIGDVYVGGYDDLSSLNRAGKLDALLRDSGAA